MRIRWILACLGGEALGIAATALVMALLNATIGEPDTRLDGVGIWAAMVGAGAIEGFALGALQWQVLRRQLPALPARRWVGATTALAMVGWAVGMAPSTLLATGQAAAGSTAEPAMWLFVLVGAGSGLLAGTAFGAVQAWALRGYATGGSGWIVVNALAWAGALTWIFTVAGLPTADWPVWAVVADGLAAGVLSGLTVGAVTSIWLPHLRPQPSHPASVSPLAEAYGRESS